MDILMIVLSVWLVAWIMLGRYTFISMIEWIGGILSISIGMMTIYYKPTLGQLKHVLKNDWLILKPFMIELINKVFGRPINYESFFNQHGVVLIGLVIISISGWISFKTFPSKLKPNLSNGVQTKRVTQS